MTDLNVVYLDPDPILKVRDEFCSPLGDDQLNPVLKDELGGSVFKKPWALENPNQAHYQCVSDHHDCDCPR